MVTDLCLLPVDTGCRCSAARHSCAPLSFLRELVSMTLGEASRGNAKHSQLSFVLAGRRSSIPETVVMGTTGRGVAGTPQVRGMTISYAAGLVLLAILIPASPAFAEPCSRPAAAKVSVEKPGQSGSTIVCLTASACNGASPR